MSRDFTVGLSVNGEEVYPGYQLASDTGVDVTQFNGLLSSADDTVQKALNTLDNVNISNPGNPSASDVSVNTADFNGLLSSADDTVQKALNTLDNVNISNPGNPGFYEIDGGSATSVYLISQIIDGGDA